MFIDEVLLVGMAVMGLMLVFVGRVGYFVWKDSREYK
ncbi:cytochrome c oxidase subunit CcoM [Azotobacter beijerinckii]|nr:cytochrome c oxidase subunit CcoM [Azotobacter beijerinckii]